MTVVAGIGFELRPASAPAPEPLSLVSRTQLAHRGYFVYPVAAEPDARYEDPLLRAGLPREFVDSVLPVQPPRAAVSPQAALRIAGVSAANPIGVEAQLVYVSLDAPACTSRAWGTCPRARLFEDRLLWAVITLPADQPGVRWVTFVDASDGSVLGRFQVV